LKNKDDFSKGMIDSENRKSQEEFECIECGYIANADINASENIKERVVSTVLRDELLKKGKLGNETFEPKKLKREKVKEVLLSFRYNLEKDKEISFST
jgi:putative transposase